MGQKKLIRFAELETFPNVFQYPPGMAGKWKEVFKNDNPLTLELACGKGEYTIGLARLFPDQNFMGVDLKGNRLWVGAKTAIKENLHNVAFLRTHIDKIEEYFSLGEVSEIWLTFPDPQLRISRAKKRLTHPKFLRHYQKILVPDAVIHLKTDSPVLYRFTKKIIELYHLPIVNDLEDLYATKPENPVLTIQTHYEKLDIAQSNRIHYLSFRLPATPLPDLDEEIKKWTVETETH